MDRHEEAVLGNGAALAFHAPADAVGQMREEQHRNHDCHCAHQILAAPPLIRLSHTKVSPGNLPG